MAEQASSNQPTDADKHDMDALRNRIGKMLAAGLQTQTEPFPERDEERYALVEALRALPAGDVEAKLVLGGFTDKHFGPAQMNCLECVYYLARRRYCDLPELAVPVEPDWWCRLWRL